jgi:hypothetical protein
MSVYECVCVCVAVCLSCVDRTCVVCIDVRPLHCVPPFSIFDVVVLPLL